MGRIFLFGSAVVSVLLLTLIYAIVSGQYVANQPVASATPTAAPSVPASASAPGSASAVPSASAAATASAPGTSASASPSGAAAMVMISSFSFGPDLTIAAGTTVTFMNNDSVKHTATNGTNGTPASGSLFDLQLNAGGSGSYTFTKPGTFKVTCTIHPTMNMTITVT